MTAANHRAAKPRARKPKLTPWPSAPTEPAWRCVYGEKERICWAKTWFAAREESAVHHFHCEPHQVEVTRA